MLNLTWLKQNDKTFPEVIEPVNEQGLFAAGGDLSPERLKNAYSSGIFPWFPFRSKILQWYCPQDRFVIFPEKIHVSHSMRTLMNSGIYKCSVNEAFADVIYNCARAQDRDRGAYAWLGPQMMNAYVELHNLSLASSVEVWHDDVLVGGLYGVTVNGCFMGESMFSLQPSASKMALIHLARTLKPKFIDCQFETPHLLSMGGEHITYSEYMKILREK